MVEKLKHPGAMRLVGADAERIIWLRGNPVSDFYPAEALRLRLDGVARVDLLLNEAGQVQEAQLLSESPPNVGFGLAGLDVAKTYEFLNPFRRPVLLTLTIEFLP